MAKRFKASVELPATEKIEVVAIRGETVIKKVMTYGEAQSMKKIKGWKYQNYQLGFCSIKETKQK